MYKTATIVALSLLLAGCPKDDDSDENARQRISSVDAQLSQDISALDGRVTTLEGMPSLNIQPLQNQVEAIESQQNVFGSDINNLYNLSNVRQANINALGMDVANLDSNLTAVFNTVADQNIRIIDLEDESADYEMRINNLEMSNSSNAGRTFMRSGSNRFAEIYPLGNMYMYDFDAYIGHAPTARYPFRNSLNYGFENITVWDMSTDDCANPTFVALDLSLPPGVNPPEEVQNLADSTIIAINLRLYRLVVQPAPTVIPTSIPINQDGSCGSGSGTVSNYTSFYTLDLLSNNYSTLYFGPWVVEHVQ